MLITLTAQPFQLRDLLGAHPAVLDLEDLDLLVVGDLDQAQFRPVAVLTHELGVHADMVMGFQAITKLCKRLGVGDKRVNLHDAR